MLSSAIFNLLLRFNVSDILDSCSILEGVGQEASSVPPFSSLPVVAQTLNCVLIGYGMHLVLEGKEWRAGGLIIIQSVLPPFTLEVIQWLLGLESGDIDRFFNHDGDESLERAPAEPTSATQQGSASSRVTNSNDTE